MARWIIGGVGVLLLVVLYILWNSADREEGSADHEEGARVDQATPADDLPSGNTEEKPTPKISKHLGAKVRSIQTTPGQNLTNESETEKEKKVNEIARPKPTGPLKILRRVYEDETSDATAEATEKLIRNAFDADYLPAEFLHSVKCHKSVCKVDMYWSEKNPLVLMALAMKLGPILTSYIAFDPEPEPNRDGRTSVSVYLLREGTISDL